MLPSCPFFLFVFVLLFFLVQEVTSFVRHFSETCPPGSRRKCVFVLHATRTRQTDRERERDNRKDRQKDIETVSPSAPNKCPGRKWSALYLSLSLPLSLVYLFLYLCSREIRDECYFIVSQFKGKLRQDTLGRTRTLVQPAPCSHILM